MAILLPSHERSQTDELDILAWIPNNKVNCYLGEQKVLFNLDGLEEKEVKDFYFERLYTFNHGQNPYAIRSQPRGFFYTTPTGQYDDIWFTANFGKNCNVYIYSPSGRYLKGENGWTLVSGLPSGSSTYNILSDDFTKYVRSKYVVPADHLLSDDVDYQILRTETIHEESVGAVVLELRYNQWNQPIETGNNFQIDPIATPIYSHPAGTLLVTDKKLEAENQWDFNYYHRHTVWGGIWNVYKEWTKDDPLSEIGDLGFGPWHWADWDPVYGGYAYVDPDRGPSLDIMKNRASEFMSLALDWFKKCQDVYKKSHFAYPLSGYKPGYSFQYFFPFLPDYNRYYYRYGQSTPEPLDEVYVRKMHTNDFHPTALKPNIHNRERVRRTQQGVLYFDYTPESSKFDIYRSSNGDTFSLIQSLNIGGPGYWENATSYYGNDGAPMLDINESGLGGILAFLPGERKYIIYRTDNSFMTYTKAIIDKDDIVTYASNNNNPSVAQQDFTMLDNGFGWFRYNATRMVTYDRGKTWSAYNGLHNHGVKWSTYKPDCTEDVIPILMENLNGNNNYVGKIYLEWGD